MPSESMMRKGGRPAGWADLRDYIHKSDPEHLHHTLWFLCNSEAQGRVTCSHTSFGLFRGMEAIEKGSRVSKAFQEQAVGSIQ